MSVHVAGQHEWSPTVASALPWEDKDTTLASTRARGWIPADMLGQLRGISRLRLIPNCGELDSSWPTLALERCAHISTVRFRNGCPAGIHAG
jgi:hypothetical protein